MDAPSWGVGCDKYVRGAVMLNNERGTYYGYRFADKER